MSNADRHISHGAPRAEKPVAGVTGAAIEIKSLLTELAGEIDDSRRRQSHALLQIERKLHALEAGKSASTSGEDDSGRERASDAAWDAESADTLADIYGHGSDGSFAYGHAGGDSDSGKSWLQSRFVDISQHLARSLSDMRPQSAVQALGERIEQFHMRVHDALDDVARRSDVEGLRLIEAHVTELGLKLTDMQAQLSRLDNIEADLRTVMDEVSGERLVRLNEHQDVLADVIEVTAQRTAEQMHARMAEANAISAIDGGRFDELRALIETAIIEQRQAEASASTVVSRIGSTAELQSDHLSDLKALVESSIDERRKGEQDAMAVLDTVQQALMQVLDRIEQLEEQHAPAAAVPDAPTFIEIPISAAPMAAAPQPSERDAPQAPAAKAERPPAWDIPSLPAAPSQPSQAAADADDADLSPVERMRRDFIADAQRAKLKAASSWADGAKGETTKGRRPMAADVAEAASNSVASLRSRLFGVSPKLLAAALGLIVAINGGILLMSRKTPAPPIAVERLKEPTAYLPAERSSTASDAETAVPEHYGERAAAKQGGRLEAHDELGTPGDDAISTPTDQLASGDADGAPYQIASETTVENASADPAPAAVPRGTTVDTPQISVTDETLAALYQQQVLAGLSGNLGNMAARAAPEFDAPEQTGSTEAAYTPPEFSQPADASEDGARSSKLDLPPPTVGPLSLRLAAAAGDRSAEFEVGSRLAEGKGTNQNFKEAIRWYQRSATQGFAQAQYRIGTLYERGLGVQKDLGRARVWYQRAAEHGNVKAMHNLAVLSAGGEGGGPDYAGATAWFIKAAEHGLPDSQYNLAVLFENGLGVKQDTKTAYKWYALAARGGDKDAIVRRDAVKAALSPADLKTAEALVSSFAPKSADPLANDARAAGEDWKKRANSDGNG